MATHSKEQHLKKPDWLKVRLPTHENYFYVSNLLKQKHLHTICENARCPNISECWSHKTATFLILGTVCTRSCAFCAVDKGVPSPLEPDEVERVVDSIMAMDLSYAVITSVTRDDLPDGGASIFAEVIRKIRDRRPQTRIEVLIPDFQGDRKALAKVLDAKPDVLNHNLEVPENIYPRIKRNEENYSRSLKVLQAAHELGASTKSGLMVGLGETDEDLLRALRDLRNASCDLLTIGQYLQATKNNAPVEKYYTPNEFERLRDTALSMGFVDVVSGPLVRSSYMAHKLYESLGKSRETS